MSINNAREVVGAPSDMHHACIMILEVVKEPSFSSALGFIFADLNLIIIIIE